MHMQMTDFTYASDIQGEIKTVDYQSMMLRASERQ